MYNQEHAKENDLNWFVIILLSPLIVSSQKAFVCLGAEIAFPAGNYMEVGNMGIGGSVRLEHTWSKHVSGMMTVEYFQYRTKETNMFLHEKFSALKSDIYILFWKNGMTTIAKSIMIR